ncbi:hypothetical protein [Flavobacterium sp.]|uniref:hypothetical protein n=1 Tax=Flavobacterium sp. TaxID=239 RepID=UPI00120CCFEF|nr:hypothetical protein [Flavobacterium sp.]RZJ70402.1 MAG: hypothetical protein EOO49_14065 [Flavobacterium sp.]
MNKHLLFFGLLASSFAFGQMGARTLVPFRSGAVAGLAAGNDFDAAGLATFGLYGVGNTNTETFTEINASGKLSGYIRPFKRTVSGIPMFVDVNFGFNVNASNTDSLAISTVLFPDVGKNSFSASVVYNLALGRSSNYYLISPFFEFATKTINGRNEDSERSFYSINSSLGVNFQYLLVQNSEKVSFSLSPYLSWVEIPEPGRSDYRFLLTADETSPLVTKIRSWGVKAAFQYNNFQIFADLRTVNGNQAELPVDGFRGFHPNIGVVFNAEIFER